MLKTPMGGGLFVFLVMACSVLGLVVVRRYADIAWLKRQHDVASFFFLMIGTLYAVLIAFAIFVVWTQFQDAVHRLFQLSCHAPAICAPTTFESAVIEAPVPADSQKWPHFRLADWLKLFGDNRKVPIGVSFCKKEKPPGTRSRAASVPLKSPPKKGIHRDDIPPFVRMSGQS